jgi:predicted component of type VI protein secretion system
MFGLEGLRKMWKHEDAALCRLVPQDAWADSGPLPVRPPAVLGRSSQADVRLSDPWVSRVHCEICCRNGELIVRDLESRHGLFVNEERVQQAVLHSGDVLLLGVTRYRVEFDEAALRADAKDHA